MEGKTISEHDDITLQVLEYLSTNPEEILPHHRQLLEVDMERLGSGPTVDRQYWVANMVSAVAAAKALRQGTVRSRVDVGTPREATVDDILARDPP